MKNPVKKPVNKFSKNCLTDTSEKPCEKTCEQIFRKLVNRHLWKPCEKTYEQSLRKFLKKHHLKIPVSKKWLKSITEICKDPLKKPVNNEGMNNNISVILHVNKTHALVNVFFFRQPSTILCSFYTLLRSTWIVKCPYGTRKLHFWLL